VSGKGDLGNKNEVEGMLDSSSWNGSKCGSPVDEVPLLGREGRVWDLNISPEESLRPRARPMLKDFCSRFLATGGLAVFVGAGIGMCFTGSSTVVVMARKALTRTDTPFIAFKKFSGSTFKQG